MIGADEKRSAMPPLRAIAGVVIVILAGLVAAAIAYRQPIAETLLMRQLRNFGLDEATFAVRRFDAGLLVLEDLSVGSGDGLDIARIEAHFSTRGLFASHLDALRISGVRLRGTLDQEGISFGPLDRLFEQSTASAESSGPTALPASGITIEDALLEIATAKGPLRVSLELHAVEIEPGRLEVDAELRVDHTLARLDAQLRAIGSPSALTGNLKLEASVAGELGSDISTSSISLAADAAFTFEDGDIAIQPEGCATIHIEGLSVKSVLTLSKPLDLCLRSRSNTGIRISKEGVIETNLEMAPAEFAVNLQIGGESQRVSGELPMLRMRASKRGGEFEVSLEMEAGRFEFAEYAIGVRDIQFKATVPRGTRLPTGSLQIGEIFDTHQVARFQSLNLNAQFEPHEDSVVFEAELANQNRELVVESSGAYAPYDATVRADLSLHAIEFAPGRLQPSTIFPFVSDLLTEVSGSIAIEGSVEWSADGIRRTVKVDVVDVSATVESVTFEGLNGTIELSESGGEFQDQTVSIDRLDVGLELTEGLIRFRAKPGLNVVIESTSWKLAGGELITVGEIDPLAKNRESSIHVKNIDLAEFIKLVNLEGLSGSGRLDGEIPIIQTEDEVEIRSATFRSSAKTGIIRYRPAPGMANIAAADVQFATALDALENFHFDRLDIVVNGSVREEVAVQIYLAGINPDYQDGQPVEFNLDVNAPLSSLFKPAILLNSFLDKLEKRVAAFAK